MNRNIVYPGAIPFDTDILSVNRNTMIALGYLAQAVFGTATVADGLGCIPTSPPSLTINIKPGSLTMLSVVDATAYGSLPVDAADPLVKMGIILEPTAFTLAAPTTPGQSVNYLIEATLQEVDADPVVLPYYNASAPNQPFSGPANSGTAQNTLRSQNVQLQLKVGAPSNTGTQTTPVVDSGWVGLYVVTVSFAQTIIDTSSIVTIPSAPFLSWKLPSLSPGFGSGVQRFISSGTFIVPPNVRQVEVELWGGGSGSFASIPGLPSGGGSGGGYARKRIAGLLPGQQIAVTVGWGGAGGTTAGLPASPGGTSTFGSFVSATGGSLNYLASPASPQNGATPAGVGIGGEANFNGSAGQAAILTQGGMGGAAPMGGAQNSGINGTLPYNGAAGAGGFVIARW
jgi:hypothetical protein